MALSKKSVGWIIASIILSLSGLVALQTLLLQSAMTLKEQTFRRNVFSALSHATQQLESGEMTSAFMDLSHLAEDDSGRIMVTIETGLSSGSIIDTEILKFVRSDSDSISMPIGFDSCDALPLEVENGTVRYNLKTGQNVMLRIIDPASGIDKVLIDTFNNPGIHELEFDEQQFSNRDFVWHFKTDSASYAFEGKSFRAGDLSQTLPSDSVRIHMVSAIVNRLMVGELEPITERIDMARLDSIVTASMAYFGLQIKPEFGVVNIFEDSVPITSNPNFNNELIKSDYKMPLFPRDLLSMGGGHYLSFFFPDRDIYLLKQMGPYLGATIILIIIIILCFAFAVRTMIAQKRFAGYLVNFINNMTHEFKTPISTVALACEAVVRDDVVGNPERVRHYSQMIQDENRRMRGQVDKILQMSVLEEGDYDLSLAEVDIHKVIEKGIASVLLQIENRGGKISSQLDAVRHQIKGDNLHLVNIFSNLLDNANKYSPDVPEIKVTTESDNNHLVINIADSGIGIASADQKMVFTKYFRVPTGNIHVAKGFGIGLSYVKLMVEAHGGTINLKSEPGRGTQVTLKFPLDNKRADVR